MASLEDEFLFSLPRCPRSSTKVLLGLPQRWRETEAVLYPAVSATAVGTRKMKKKKKKKMGSVKLGAGCRRRRRLRPTVFLRVVRRVRLRALVARIIRRVWREVGWYLAPPPAMPGHIAYIR